jgi:membrane-associated phospholipid phosphatase
LNLQPADLGTVLPVRSSGWVKHLLDLRAGQDMAVSLREDASLVGFPSFHMEAAILSAWFFWRSRVLRWPAILLNALMATAAPLFGGHYVADLVAGTLVALLSIHLAKLVLVLISDRKDRLDWSAAITIDTTDLLHLPPLIQIPA